MCVHELSICGGGGCSGGGGGGMKSLSLFWQTHVC